tara:strand:+ start:1246 stop:1884 length:639 start_codon:yes stop_codon:yes gene_type:complete
MLKKGLFYLFITISTLTWAQGPILPNAPTFPTDSTEVSSLVKVKKPRDPVRASILSAILPGAGQVYNRKWWKAPIVWGGFISAFVVHDFYYDKHKFYHEVLILKDQEVAEATIAIYAENNKEGDRFTNRTGDEIAALTQTQLQSFNDDAEKRKQQVYLMSTLFYILQIVDASVDAHFSTFDVSDDLSLQIKPSLMQNQTAFVPGINLKFSLR